MPRNWLNESVGIGVSRVWEVEDVLVNKHTKHQHVQIVQLPQAHGVALFCDGQRQSCQSSQEHYHKMMVEPCIDWLPVKKGLEKQLAALVLGSSEGVIPMMLLKYCKIIDHVDIDRQCVELCAEHLPYGYPKNFQTDPLLAEIKRHYMDAWEFVQNAEDELYNYDLVICDLPDADCYSLERFYRAPFYKKVEHILNKPGVFCTQSGPSLNWQQIEHKTIAGELNKVFGPQKIQDKHDTVWVSFSAEQGWSWAFARKP